MNDKALVWMLPLLLSSFVALQLRYGRVVLGWSAGQWRFVEKRENEARFWLFIAAETVVVLILIAQAFSA